MFSIIEIFNQKELDSYLIAHPYRRNSILKRIKKSQISLEERYFIRLKSRIHKNFWITERHLIPIFSEEHHFSIVIEDCPICSGEHHLTETNIQVLKENCPSLVEDLEYIARQAKFRAKKVYMKSLATGKNADRANTDYTDAYILIAKELANDTKRGEILYFPDAKSS